MTPGSSNDLSSSVEYILSGQGPRLYCPTFFFLPHVVKAGQLSLGIRLARAYSCILSYIGIFSCSEYSGKQKVSILRFAVCKKNLQSVNLIP